MTSAGVCSIDGCGNKVQARGLCAKHYQRQRRNGTTDTVYRQTGLRECSIEGCTNIADSQGLCLMHYSRKRRGSEVADVPERVYGGPLIDRIHRRMSEPNADGCQVWTGQITGGSELPVIMYRTTTLSVRRVLWEDTHGEELGGRWVVTTCSTPRCVAPEHLRTTTVHEYNSKHARSKVTSR